MLKPCNLQRDRGGSAAWEQRLRQETATPSQLLTAKVRAAVAGGTRWLGSELCSCLSRVHLRSNPVQWKGTGSQIYLRPVMLNSHHCTFGVSNSCCPWEPCNFWAARRECRSSVTRLWSKEAQDPGFYVQFSCLQEPNNMPAAALGPA